MRVTGDATWSKNQASSSRLPSPASLESSRRDFAYSTSKAGVTHLVKILPNYFGDYKIRVNAIAPGMFSSEMTAGNPAVFGKDPTKESGLPNQLALWRELERKKILQAPPST